MGSEIVQQVRRVVAIINLKTAIIAILSMVSMLVCRKIGLSADFPLALIATAVVFPIVFSINSAYKRRETALSDYGSIKSHGHAIFLAARDWLEEQDPALQAAIRDDMGGLLTSIRDLLVAPAAELRERERSVYDAFSRLSMHIKGFRTRGMVANEVSRCNQYLSKMVVSFENLKHIYQYRTPVTLRAYSNIFILLLPILYGPYFAEISKDYSQGLEFLMPVLFSVILVGLDNIQEHLENPFDQIGEDDIVINAETYLERLDG